MKIKICGFTTLEEVNYVNTKNIDFAGIVLFFPKSKRNNTIENAKVLIDNFSSNIKTVAVTVNPTTEQVKLIINAGFDYIQIHGDINEEVLDICTIPILKAFNVSDMDKYEEYHHCPKIAGYVFDANEPGSGKTFDWNLVSNIPRDEKLLILAGGLNPYNVSDAINAIHPDGVDVSSGVEYCDKAGKDPAKIDEFCRAVNS